ncbi:MAG: hypothetical protein QGG25_14410 [Phycisphaerae bacterium]|nr:hypothetical protein [Phycisphaerae bacterium]
MTRLHRTGLGLLSLFVIAIGGCAQPIPKTQVSLNELVSEYNANAKAVPMIAAYADIEYTMYHESTGVGLPLWSSPNGLLRMEKGPDPLGTHDMVMIGRELSRQVMRVGTSRKDNVYYMWTLIPDPKAMWGHMKLAGAPGIENLPINPTGLQVILGICQLPDGRSKSAGVTLRMDTTSGRYAYVVGYISRQPVTDKLVVNKEFRFAWDEKRPNGLSEFFWGKQKPRRLEEVNFYDMNGRKVVSAQVGDYKPVEIDPEAAQPKIAPIMPTRIRITWFNKRQQKTSSVLLRLSQMTTEKQWETDVCDFLDNVPDEISDYEIIQVDKDIPFGDPVKKEGSDK